MTGTQICAPFKLTGSDTAGIQDTAESKAAGVEADAWPFPAVSEFYHNLEQSNGIFLDSWRLVLECL